MILVFDTETTDLIKNSLRPLARQPRLMEFFGLKLDPKTLEEVGVISQMINPGIPIPETSKEITKITDEMVAKAPRINDVIGTLAKEIESASMVVAHNISYDIAVMNFEAARCGVTINWPQNLVCTVEATEWIKGHRLNLGSLHLELFGEPFTGAHRAEHDVRATARCFIELVKRGEIVT